MCAMRRKWLKISVRLQITRVKRNQMENRRKRRVVAALRTPRSIILPRSGNYWLVVASTKRPLGLGLIGYLIISKVLVKWLSNLGAFQSNAGMFFRDNSGGHLYGRRTT